MHPLIIVFISLLVFIFATVVFLLVFFRNNPEIEGELKKEILNGSPLIPKSCTDWAKKNWNKKVPEPVCSNSSLTFLSTSSDCQNLTGGKCAKPYSYGICPDVMKYNDGKCVA
jgi:hypothetical protein